MPDWFKRRRAGDGWVAVCPGAQGVAAAAVSRAPDRPPVLEWVDYAAAARAAGPRRDAVSALLRAHRAQDRRATSLMPLGDYSLLLVEAPEVPAAELRAAVRWRVKDLVDFSADEAVVDVFEVPPMKGGRGNMVYAVVARRNAVRRIIDELEAADVALDCVDVPELAIRNLAALVPEDVGGMAFIHLDEQVGLITITRQQELYLSRRFDCGRERLFASGAREVTREIEGLLDAIVIEVQRSLDYYESQFAQPPVQALVVAHPGRELAGLDDYLGRQLGIPARILDLGAVIDTRATMSVEQQSRCLTAIGAALRTGEAAP